MSVVAKTLGVARSHLHDRTKGERQVRGPYHKPEDEELLVLVRRLVDERPTYGYRRITALVRRELAKQNKPLPNHKRIYRLMKRHDLLLQRATGRREGRIHDGKVIVMQSDLRWCSDAFEFSCWNGEVVRVGFVIDAFDREILAHVAVANAGVSGSDVRDMMIEAVEARFQAPRAPKRIEFLSDNGSPYTAKDTRDFAVALNLEPCFTPVASPESNGVAEAFVKTIKRDYVRISALKDAKTALSLIAGWITDYNENHPHSGLKWTSPREFRSAQNP